MSETSPIRAIVEKVILHGGRVPYAVARSEKISSITFSLCPPVWTEEDDPEPGEVVFLSHLRQLQKGWRANKAQRTTNI